MKMIYRISLCLCCLLLLACSNELTSEVSSGDGTITVQFTLKLPAGTVSGTTRTGSTYNENSIEDVHILVFEHAADGTGKFVGLSKYTVRTDDELNKKVTCQTELPRTGIYDIVALANLPAALNPDNIEDLPDAIGGDTKAHFIAWFEDNCATGPWDMSRPIPLWGEITKELSNAYNHGELSVDLVRSMARIDVKVADNVTDFKIESIRLYNASRNWQIIPGLANWNATDQKATAPTESKSGYDPDTDGYLYTLETPGTTAEAQIYTPEAPAGSVPLSDRWTNNTCLVIGGYFGIGNTDHISYYRIDLTDADGNYLALLRNHHYTVTINGVLYHGQNSPQAALAAHPVNSIYTTVEWKNLGYEATLEGAYTITVDRSLVYLSNIEYHGNGDVKYQINVQSNYSGEWKASVDVDYISLSTTGDYGEAMSEVSSTGDGILYLFVDRNNSTTTDLEAKITIEAGGVQIPVKVIQRHFDGVQITNSTGVFYFVNFYSLPGVVPAPQTITVKWSGMSDLNIENSTSFTSNGTVEAFEWLPETPTTTAYAATGKCEQTYTVAPPALPSNWLTIYPEVDSYKSIRRTQYIFGTPAAGTSAVVLTHTYPD